MKIFELQDAIERFNDKSERNARMQNLNSIGIPLELRIMGCDSEIEDVEVRRRMLSDIEECIEKLKSDIESEKKELDRETKWHENFKISLKKLGANNANL